MPSAAQKQSKLMSLCFLDELFGILPCSSAVRALPTHNVVRYLNRLASGAPAGIL
jgi:hypothetical protein